jgi:hypothetical protein
MHLFKVLIYLKCGLELDPVTTVSLDPVSDTDPGRRKKNI